MSHESMGRDESCEISAAESVTVPMAARLSAMCDGFMERGFEGRPRDQSHESVTCAAVAGACAAVMAASTGSSRGVDEGSDAGILCQSGIPWVVARAGEWAVEREAGLRVIDSGGGGGGAQLYMPRAHSQRGCTKGALCCAPCRMRASPSARVRCRGGKAPG